jgi:hypothetical protein
MRVVLEFLDNIRSDIEMLPISIASDFRPASTVDRVVTRLRYHFASSAEAKDTIVLSFYDRWKAVTERVAEDHIYPEGTPEQLEKIKQGLEMRMQGLITDYANRPKDLLFTPKIN